MTYGGELDDSVRLRKSAPVQRGAIGSGELASGLAAR